MIDQGCWEEAQSDAEAYITTRANVRLLYGHGVYTAFLDLLSMETENASAASNAMRKLTVCLADSLG